MNDRELLEFAAKAAGYQVEWVRNSGCHYRCEEDASREQWCPLDDDGDALRLAVDLRFDVENNGHFASVVCADIEHPVMSECNDGDKYATTRRAIVRAAAAIGSAM